MINDKHKEHILNKITQQVIRLDDRRRKDANLRQTVEDHVDALAEITTLEKSEIDTMAQAICAEYNDKASSLPSLKRTFKRYYWLVLATAVVLFIGLVWIVAQFSGYRSGVRDTSPAVISSVENRRDAFIKSSLVHALARLNPIKLMFLEEYVVTGQYPKTLKQIGIDNTKYEDKYIRNIQLLPQGQIQVRLTSLFGENRYLILKSNLNESLGRFDWQCTTNIPQEIMGAKSAASCINETLDGIGL